MSATTLQTTVQEERLANSMDKAISAGLVVSQQTGGVAFADANQVMEFAKMMAVSNIGVRKHLRGNPGACLAVVVQAVEWGMSAYAVANKSYLVNDQIAYEAQLINAVILRRAPIRGRIKVSYSGEGEKRKCKVWVELRGEPGEIVEYESPPVSQIHPKNSPLWKSDPDQQQFYYSSRAMCRRHFPDVLLGVYSVDELPGSPTEEDSQYHVGAERARPVYSNLKEKLDALAKPTPPHDPETGEVIEPQSDGDGARGDAQTEQVAKPNAAPKPSARAATAKKNETAGPAEEVQRDKQTAAGGDTQEGGSDTRASDRDASPAVDQSQQGEEGDRENAQPTRADIVEAARKKGREDRLAGKMRKAMPAEYKQDVNEDLHDAYVNGHKAMDKELAAEAAGAR